MAGFRVEIEHEGKRGRVEYNESTMEFRVEHPDPEIVKTVTGYPSARGNSGFPEPNRIDDYREEIRRPTESSDAYGVGSVGRILPNRSQSLMGNEGGNPEFWIQ